MTIAWWASSLAVLLRQSYISKRYNYIQKGRQARILKLGGRLLDVFVISDPRSCSELLQSHAVSKEPFIGFDTEWRSSVWCPERTVGNTSVLQIATSSAVFVIQLDPSSYGFWGMKRLPKELREILENESCIKVGFNVLSDIKKLKDISIDVNGYVDVENIYGLRPCAMSLANLYLSIFRVDMKKSKRATLSDWSQQFLTETQIRYAALDAAAVYDLYQHSLINEVSTSELETIVKSEVSTTSSSNTTNLLTKIKGTKITFDDETWTYKEARFLKLSKNNSMKRPLYDNCVLLAPDGELLSLIPIKRAKWYLSNELAIEIPNRDRVTIQLKFEPKARNNTPGEYHTIERHNICVCCGGTKFLIRHYIVPHSFRQHFPIAFKTHDSHDIVLLCPKCNLRASYASRAFRDELVVTTLTLDGMSSEEIADRLNNRRGYTDGQVFKARKAASALLTARDKIPESRQQFLEKEVRMVLSHVDESQVITDEQLQEVLDMDPLIYYENWEPVEKHVFKSLVLENKNKPLDTAITDFVIKWRKLFVENCSPQHLPKSWCLDHRLEKS